MAVSTLGAAIACGTHLFIIITHIVFVAVVLLVSAAAPPPVLPWLLGFLPLVLVLYLLFGECPLTTLEYVSQETCATHFTPVEWLPSLDPEWGEEVYGNRQSTPHRHFFRRFVHGVTGWTLTEADVAVLMVCAWWVCYGIMMVRCGHVSYLWTLISR